MTATSTEIHVPISPGELIDKLTILEIKAERMRDAKKVANVRHELELLQTTWSVSAYASIDIATEKMRVEPRACAMLGDRLDTDIEGAQRAGLKSILVLTGVTSRELLAKSAIQPDFTYENLDALRLTAWLKALVSTS